MTRQLSREEVKTHNNRGSCWVTVKEKVYDITSFLADHPGGDDILIEFGGTDVTFIMDDANYHSHSSVAYELLEEHYVGDLVRTKDDLSNDVVDQLAVKDYHTSSHVTSATFDKLRNNRDEEFLDLRKALFPQLISATYTKAFYLEQVHKPRYTPYCVPYFDNPTLDMLSKTQWYIVPIVWLPFIFYQLCTSLYHCVGGSVGTTLKGFAAGVLFWTLFEYTLHRFLFHLDDLLPDHPYALLIHFTLHGIHHHMPMDRLRLVMPPALTALLSIPVFKLAHTLFYPALAHAFIAGAFFGYVCYDMIHFYLHHAKVIELYFREMKRYHVAHHYKDFNSGFGITSKLWDYVFGTVLEYDEK